MSKVAMRSDTGTKSGEPDLVVFVTNSTMAFFAGPSFHEGNGSAARALAVMKATEARSAVVMQFWLRMAFMVSILLPTNVSFRW